MSTPYSPESWELGQELGYESALWAEAEAAYEGGAITRAPRFLPPWVRNKYIKRANREMEFDAFDPSPSPPGTTIVPGFGVAQSKPLSLAQRRIIARIATDLVGRIPYGPSRCALIEIVGHEDEVGDPALFGKFGRDRAVEVAKELVKIMADLRKRRGIPDNSNPVVLVVGTAGPTKPIRSNVTAAGRALNRRAAIRTKVDLCPGISSI